MSDDAFLFAESTADITAADNGPVPEQGRSAAALVLPA